MSNIHFPLDNQTQPVTTKKTSPGESVKQADAITPDPEQQRKQSGHQQHKHQTEADDREHNSNVIDNKQVPAKIQRELIPRDKERRKQNRRQQNTAVLLDTRSQHDRRKKPGLRKEDQADKQTFGIDIKA